MYQKIGFYIRALRKDQKLTQEQLAEKAEISASFMGHIERGSRIPSVETLGKIANALGCTFDELLECGMQSNIRTLEQELNRVIAELQIIKKRFS